MNTNKHMKAWHFLQVSSEIIGKNRYRSDVTGMTNINSSLSPRPAINQTPQVPFWAAPKPRLKVIEAEVVLRPK